MLGYLSRRRGVIVGGLLILVALGVLTSGREDTGPLGRTLGVLGAPVQAVVDGTARWVGGLVDHYIFLVGAREESERLRAEVDELQRELMAVQEVALENQRLKTLLEFKETRRYPLLPARVVGRSASAWYRTLVLDKGTEDGVTATSPVLAAAGVVGRVYEVSEGSSRVLLLTDASSAVDALVQPTRDQVLLEGNMNPRPSMLYLARGSDAAPGDPVVTSGLDGIYPKGLLLGKISEVSEVEGDFFLTALLEPSVDFARIEEVFVILPAQEALPASPPSEVKEQTP